MPYIWRNRMLRLNHVACTGSSQHCLNIARIVGEIDPRNFLSDKSIPWKVRIYRTPHLIFRIQIVIIDTKRDCLFQIIIAFLRFFSCICHLYWFKRKVSYVTEHRQDWNRQICHPVCEIPPAYCEKKASCHRKTKRLTQSPGFPRA